MCFSFSPPLIRMDEAWRGGAGGRRVASRRVISHRVTQVDRVNDTK
jgi:hypothetical protein